jgi:hypothetical protein
MIERAGGTNRQVVVYSPYPMKSILDQSLVAPDEFGHVGPTFLIKDGYYYRELTTHNVWAGQFEESCKVLLDEHFVYARWVKDAPSAYVLSLIAAFNINLNISGAKLKDAPISVSGRRDKRYLDGVALLIEADILAKVSDNPYVYSEDAEKTVGVAIGFEAQIGDMYYNQSVDTWTTSPYADGYINTNKSDKSSIGNKWVPLGRNGEGFLIKLGNTQEELVFNGRFDLFINSSTKLQLSGGPMADNNLLQEVWIKNISIRVVNFDGSEISDADLEYIGLLDGRLALQGDTIVLTCGTQSRFADRGKLLAKNGDNYIDIMQCTRNLQTFKIEELLLNSLCSNYRANFITLSSMNLKNEFAIMNTLSDSYSPGKVLMISQAIVNYYDNITTCKLVEISQDVLQIIK